MIRKEEHTRTRFASQQFNKYALLLHNVLKVGSIQGNNPQKYLNKLNQANRIWYNYSHEFGKSLNNEKLS